MVQVQGYVIVYYSVLFCYILLSLILLLLQWFFFNILFCMYDRLMENEDEEYNAIHFNEEYQDQTDQESEKEKKKGRQYTIFKNMKLRKEGNKIELLISILGQPIGEISIDFQTYMGHFTHNKVSFFIPTWPKMQDDVPTQYELMQCKHSKGKSHSLLSSIQ